MLNVVMMMVLSSGQCENCRLAPMILPRGGERVAIVTRALAEVKPARRVVKAVAQAKPLQRGANLVRGIRGNKPVVSFFKERKPLRKRVAKLRPRNWR